MGGNDSIFKFCRFLFTGGIFERSAVTRAGVRVFYVFLFDMERFDFARNVRTCWLCGNGCEKFEKCSRPSEFSNQSVMAIVKLCGAVRPDGSPPTEDDVVCKQCVAVVTSVDFHSSKLEKSVDKLKERVRHGETSEQAMYIRIP